MDRIPAMAGARPQEVKERNFGRLNPPTQDDELLKLINQSGGQDKVQLLDMLEELRALPQNEAPEPGRGPSSLQGGIFDRATKATQSGLMGDDYINELAMMRRRAAEGQADIRQQQESVLGPETGAPALEDNLVQYYRSLGLPDEMIFQELSRGAENRR